MTLAERIKRWRKWSGLSQAELANKVGVSATAAFYWELGEDHKKSSQPTHDNVEKIADAFGVSVPIFYSTPPSNKRAS